MPVTPEPNAAKSSSKRACVAFESRTNASMSAKRARNGAKSPSTRACCKDTRSCDNDFSASATRRMISGSAAAGAGILLAGAGSGRRWPVSDGGVAGRSGSSAGSGRRGNAPRPDLHSSLWRTTVAAAVLSSIPMADDGSKHKVVPASRVLTLSRPKAPGFVSRSAIIMRGGLMEESGRSCKAIAQSVSVLPTGPKHSVAAAAGPARAAADRKANTGARIRTRSSFWSAIPGQSRARRNPTRSNRSEA